jgi:hypothetical protein
MSFMMESNCEDEMERYRSHIYLHFWTLYHKRCMKNEQMQSYLKSAWYIKISCSKYFHVNTTEKKNIAVFTTMRTLNHIQVCLTGCVI